MKLHEKYNHPDDIPLISMTEMKQAVMQKQNQSKFHSYLQMNPQLKRPDVYDQYHPVHKLHSVTRLRCVSHELAVETGRHHQHKLPREERLCSCGEMEDETHFVLNCSHYTHIREKYFETNMSLSDVLDKVWTMNFIHEPFEHRKVCQPNTEG